MRCPKCRSRMLNVAVCFTGEVSCRFSGDGEFQLLDQVALDSEFAEDADCSCMTCGWTGTVAEARPGAPTGGARHEQDTKNRAVASEPLTEENLARFSACLDDLSPKAAGMVKQLIAEVRRLNALLEMVMRFSASRRSSADDDDTVIG